MERINVDTMDMDSPEYEASMIINLSQDYLERMNEAMFEFWFSMALKREEFLLGGRKFKVSETNKKAILHFIAFWYYRNKEQ